MFETLAKRFDKKVKFVENLIHLFLEGSTVPFIARYRKEQTNGMNETEIRDIIETYEYLVNLSKRKEEVISAIEEKGKLTDELKSLILKAETLKEVEDIYAPYKSKKKTKADIAKEAGLEGLSQFIKKSDDIEKISKEAEKYISDIVKTVEEAVSMALDIIQEEISHDLDIKNRLREIIKEHSLIVCEKRKEVNERTNYEDYYNFSQKLSLIPPHRILAIFRGEKEKILRIKIEIDDESSLSAILSILTNKEYYLNEYILKSTQSAYKKNLFPSIELELRNELKDGAELKAIEVFGKNLKSLLMTPPVKNRRIMGIDPAYRTGCKVAVVDETGKLLAHTVVYPTPPQSDIHKSSNILLRLIKDYNINAVSIGNGTASRETEEFVANMITDNNLNIEYTIVSEAGASVYSASDVAVKEFPELDVTIRGAISIARRVLDPLSELVKIDPKSIGVGMYQHDVHQGLLKSKLSNVVEDVVNSVGVDLNTSSAFLLKYVSGLNSALAEKIVKFREDNGRFANRDELKKIPGIGEQTFNLCAGFLKIYEGNEKLDRFFIHPESYKMVYALLDKLKLSVENSKAINLALKGKKIDTIADQIGAGLFTLKDIIDNLEKPDIDIRDSLDPVIFKKGVVDIEDLSIGMNIDGKITNVVDFGAFVDIGLKNDALVHRSEMADKYIRHPSDIVSVGQTIKFKIISIDTERGRVSLSCKSR